MNTNLLNYSIKLCLANLYRLKAIEKSEQEEIYFVTSSIDNVDSAIQVFFTKLHEFCNYDINDWKFKYLLNNDKTYTIELFNKFDNKLYYKHTDKYLTNLLSQFNNWTKTKLESVMSLRSF